MLTLLAAEPPAQNGSTSDLIIQLLVAIGASGVIGTILTAVLSRRKTQAETRKLDGENAGAHAQAAATLTGSALSLIAPQQAQIERQEAQIERQDSQLEEQRQQIRELAERIDKLELDRERSHKRETELTNELADTRNALGDLHAWALAAWALITQAGLDIDPPPGTRRPPQPRRPTD